MLSSNPVLGTPPTSAFSATNRALAMLELIYASVARERSAYAVLLTGPAGGGRSHLASDFMACLVRRDDPPEILYGRACPRAAEEPFGLAADVLRRTAGVDGAAWEAWLSAKCVARPVVLVLDGMEWADAATVDVIGGVLRRSAELPLLVVALGRAEVEERLSGLWEGVGVLVVPMGR